MDDYIDRIHLLDEIEKLKKSPWYNENDEFIRITRKDAVGVVVDLCIKGELSIDAVKVVRCEYCEHWDKHNNIINFCKVHKEKTGKFYFCASGVEKDEYRNGKS